jgi:3-oxoacyl-[acyl-carrier-protein] synthase II
MPVGFGNSCGGGNARESGNANHFFLKKKMRTKTRARPRLGAKNVRWERSEVGGCGMSSDAYHLTAPHPEGIGVIAVMENTLRDAGMTPEQVDHINTHGTSTPLGDVAELKAISAVFGSHAKNININSTKSMTGHLLGAAGAIEAIASILSMKHGIVPPTINHTVVDENIDPSLNLTLNKAQKREVNVAMSNTFGFGGHNACVLFKKIQD